MSATDTKFIQTYRQTYPYSMVHVDTCAIAKRVTRGSEKSFEDIASDRAALNSRAAEFHEACIKPHSELWVALVQRANAITEQRSADQRRRDAIIDMAVAQVARDNLMVGLVELTPKERSEYEEMCSQIKSGAFTPHSVRDLRTVAIKTSDYYR